MITVRPTRRVIRPRHRWRRIVVLPALAMLTVLVLPATTAVAAPGPWHIVESPNLGPFHNHLQEVSCVDTDRCVAVGFNQHKDTGFRQSVAATLIGGLWKLSPVPARGTGTSNLWNVSCVSRTRCVAVGFYWNVTAGYYQTLIATYNGTTWALAASPSRANVDNFLFGVDCFDDTHCVAVGRSFDPHTDVSRSLVLTLTGTSWALTASPNRANADNLLADVSCGDITHCVAVGYSVDNTDNSFQTLVMGRNNISWAVRTSVNRAGASNLLRDVACPSATTCVAVGASDPGTVGGLDEVSLIQTLTAGVWTLATSRNRAGYDNHLWAVSCNRENSCVAAGQSQNDTIARPLIQTLSAGTWGLTTPAPYRGRTFNFLYGLSCPTRQCNAVGDYVQPSTGMFRTGILTNRP